MITITSKNFQEKLASNQDEIILNGPPNNLRGTIFFSNPQNEHIFIRDLPFVHPKGMEKQKTRLPETFRLNIGLRAGEEKNYATSYQLHPQTPPGTYQTAINIGGKERKLTLIVQENTRFDLTPSMINFLGVDPGKTYEKELLLTNTGNVPLTIPDIRHNTVLDFDYICRNLSIAIREKGGEGFTATMDELTRKIHDDMADWMGVSIAEAGQKVGAGDVVRLHIALTMPGNADPRRDYFGNIRIWNRVLSYKIKSEKTELSIKPK